MVTSSVIGVKSTELIWSLSTLTVTSIGIELYITFEEYVPAVYGLVVSVSFDSSLGMNINTSSNTRNIASKIKIRV